MPKKLEQLGIASHPKTGKIIRDHRYRRYMGVTNILSAFESLWRAATSEDPNRRLLVMVYEQRVETTIYLLYSLDVIDALERDRLLDLLRATMKGYFHPLDPVCFGGDDL